MARLGRQVDHFASVDIDSITADFSSDMKYRYTLRMKYMKDLMDQNRNKILTIILKNPSSADEKRSDSTIRKVETYVWQRFPDVVQLNIYNLFAYRATDAIELHKLMMENDLITGVGKDNDHFLEELLKESDYLICSWGGPSAIKKDLYQSRINQVKQIVKEKYSGPAYHVKGAKDTTEPLHGLMWGYEYELLKFAL